MRERAHPKRLTQTGRYKQKIDAASIGASAQIDLAETACETHTQTQSPLTFMTIDH